MDDEETKERFGNLYRDFSHDTAEEKRDIKIYLWIFFVRRLCFSLLTVLCFDFPVLQVIGQILLTLVSVIFILEQRVFKDERRLMIEVFNELALLFVSILFLYPLRFESRDDTVVIGYLILGILAILIIVNIAYIVKVVLEQRRQKKLESLRKTRVAHQNAIQKPPVEGRQRKEMLQVVSEKDDESENGNSEQSVSERDVPKDKIQSEER